MDVLTRGTLCQEKLNGGKGGSPKNRDEKVNAPFEPYTNLCIQLYWKVALHGTL